MFQKLKSILLKSSLRQVGIYTITGSLCKAVSFAALPFFVNTLSEGDIGILTIFSNCIVFLTPIVSMGVLYTISVDYFKLPKAEYAKVFSTSLIIPAVLCILLVPVLYFFQGPPARAFNFQPAFLWLIPLSLFLNFCFEAFIILIRNQNKVKLFATISFLKVIIEIGLSVLFIVWLYKSWYSRALAFLLSGLVVSVFFFIHVRRQNFLVKAIDTNILRKEISFGLSGMLLQTAIFFINTSDKFFVMSFFGKNQAGYYAVAATFATIQYIVCVSMLQYLQPLLFSKFAEGKKWKYVKGLFYKYMLAMGITLVAVNLFAVLVYHFILRPAYQPYLYYFYILSISSFIWTVANIFLQFIVFTKDKKMLLQLAISWITVAVAVNYFSSAYGGINWLTSGQVIINITVVASLLIANKKLKFFS